MTDEPVAVKRGLLTAGGRPGNWLSGLGIPDERLPDHHALGGTDHARTGTTGNSRQVRRIG